MKNTTLAAIAVICVIIAGARWATFGSAAPETHPLQPGAVTAANASAHIGETITVEGFVSEVHISERATFIDLGGRYPNEEFTGVIFTDDAGAFSDVSAYEGKTVDITGTVQMYHGRPEIILRSPSQIRIE